MTPRLVRQGGAAAAAVVLLAGRGAASLGAQDIGPRGALVNVSVQPETVTVGQPFTVRIRVQAPKIATIHFPAVPDTGSAVEALDPRSIEEGPPGAVLDQTAVYRFAAWDVGPRAPVFADVVVAAAGTQQRFAVSPAPVVVTSILPADSTQRVPRGARDPVEEPSGLWRLWLLLAVLLTGLAWYWRHRRRMRTVVPPDPEPWLAATSAFRALDALALSAAGEPGRHVIAHVDVMRAYLARRFPAAAGSLTPAQLAAAIATSDFPVLPERLAAVLEEDARVRFAHAAIAPEAADAIARDVRAIVGDVQTAYEERLRAADRGPRRVRRR